MPTALTTTPQSSPSPTLWPLLATLFACLALPASPLQAQTPLPLSAEKDGFKVQLLDLKWTRARNWGMAPSDIPACELSFAARLEADGAPAGNYEDEIQLQNEAGQELALGSRRVKDGIVSGSFRNFDPRLKKAFLIWENKRPGAPADATGKTHETLTFPAIAIPAPATTTTPNLTLVTKRGSSVLIKSIERTEAGLKISLESRPPKDTTGFYPGPNLLARQAVDDKGTDMTGAKPVMDKSLWNGTVVTARFDLPVPPAAEAKTLTLNLDMYESAPLQKKPEWFRQVRMEISPQSLPYEKLANPGAPLATVKQDRATATAMEVRRFGAEFAQLDLWFSSEAASPGDWRIKSATVVEENGTDRFVHRGGNFLGTPVFWKADGAPASVGENGVGINFGRPATPFSLDVTAEKVRRGPRQEFTFEAVPFPLTPGEMVTPNLVSKAPDGTEVVLRKVGRFDTGHQPIIGPYSPNAKPLQWEGLVLVFECRPPGQAGTAPLGGASTVAARFSGDEVRDDTGVSFRGGAPLNGTSFGSHDGDIWRTREKDATGLTFTETRKTWYSMFKPLPSPGAKTLRVTIKADVDTILESPPTFHFENLPAPKP